MARIQFTNINEVLAGFEKKKKLLDQLPQVAKQMGQLAVNEIKPLCNVKSGTWQGSIHAEVTQQGRDRVELWVGSKGAFSGDGYNYGAKQERLYHPIEIGVHKALPAMTDHWNQAMHGQASRTVSSSNIDEFGMMGGF